MKLLDDFVESSAEEMNEILNDVMHKNDIEAIEEDLVNDIFNQYLGHKALIVLWNLFYVFCHALVVVWLIGSEVLDLPSWCRILLCLGILKHVPICTHHVSDFYMEQFGKTAADLFKNNEDQWRRK
jgi:hypothetical protein